MKQRNKKVALGKLVLFVPLVVKKSGAGKHRDKKRESKGNYHAED